MSVVDIRVPVEGEVFNFEREAPVRICVASGKQVIDRSDKNAHLFCIR